MLLLSTISNTETWHSSSCTSLNIHTGPKVCSWQLDYYLSAHFLLLLLYPPGNLFSTANSLFSITVIKNTYICFLQGWRSVLLFITNNICQQWLQMSFIPWFLSWSGGGVKIMLWVMYSHGCSCFLSGERSEMNLFLSPFFFFPECKGVCWCYKTKVRTSLLLDLKKCKDLSVVPNRCLSTGPQVTQVKYSDTKIVIVLRVH